VDLPLLGTGAAGFDAIVSARAAALEIVLLKHIQLSIRLVGISQAHCEAWKQGFEDL
jgi:hypothetical protein